MQICYNLSGDKMNTIKENIINTITINKSTFIACLYRIKNKKDIEGIIIELKKEYRDANHYCYAYILDRDHGFSDDKEPNGTAGLPILDTLKKTNLNYIVCVVIRYFGGIKLGAGGLVRAYRKSALEAIKIANIITLVDGYFVKIKEDYDKQKEIEQIISNNYTKEYEQYVIYSIYCSEEIYLLLSKFNIIYKEPMLIEKEK